MAADYYDILGVAADASSDDIKKSFRSLARKYHPDATGGDSASAERYKQISEAYAVLSDPRRRREYDASRSAVGGFGPFSASVEDLFESFFGGAGGRRTRRRGRSRRGESIEIEVDLELRDAVFGGSRTVTFNRYEPCEACSATGCKPGTKPETCTRCSGTGQIQDVRRSPFGSLVTAYPCAACSETGQVIPSPCEACRGAGRIARDVEVAFEVPAGVQTGDRLRMTGQGESGAAGGERGDLYVRFHVLTDDRFVRSGDDLATWVEVPMTVAALGGEVRFETLDGPESIDVPAGTQGGDVFRLRSLGAPRRGGRGRGDLLVKAQVLTPTGLDPEQERLLRRLAEMRREHPHSGEGVLAKLRRALRFETDV